MRRRLLLTSDSTHEHSQGVDMGVTTGILWDTNWMGSESIDDPGLFFTWGNVEGRHAGDGVMTWDEYKTTPGYTLTTNIPTSPSYDAARKYYGEPWRIPSFSEFLQLIVFSDCSFYNTTKNGKTIRMISIKSQVTGNELKIPLQAYYFTNQYHEAGEQYTSYFTIQNSTIRYTDPTDDSHFKEHRIGLAEYDSDYGQISFDSNLTSFRNNYMQILAVMNKEPEVRANVLFYNKTTNQKQVFQPSEIKTLTLSNYVPLAIEVVPRAHNRYGDSSGGFITICSLTSDGTPASVSEYNLSDYYAYPQCYVKWSETSGSTSITAYGTIDGTNTSGKVQTQYSGSSVTYFNVLTSSGNTPPPNITYPYTTKAATTTKNYTSGALKDYGGKTNTYKLNGSTYTAAYVCQNYETSGTSKGDWYLPSLAELAYMPSVHYSVNETIMWLNKRYGNIGSILESYSGRYWTSSPSSDSNVYTCSLYNGRIYSSTKTSYVQYYVRPFIRYKDGD